MKGRVATLCRIFPFRRLAGLLAGLSLLASAAPAGAVTDLPVFEPKRYDRLQGAPTVYADTFERCEPSDLALLRVWNGDGKVTRITAAEVFVNGAEVFTENAFKKPVDYLEKLIPVRQVNELKVVLKSGDFKEPSFLRIAVLGKNCDATAPVITSPTPAEGALLNNGRPRITAAWADEHRGSGLDLATAHLLVDGEEVTGQAAISPDGIGYSPAAPLPEGDHSVVASVSDRAFNAAELAWSFTTDTIAPVVQVTSHADGVYLSTPAIAVSGTLSEPVLSVTVNGVPAAVDGNGFTLAGVSLAEGANACTVEAVDRAGNRGSTSLTVNLDTVPPVIVLTAPPQGLLTNQPQVNVAGTADESILAATVNGTAAVLDGQGFMAAAFPLAEGENLLTATVLDRAGNSGTASVRVRLDTIAPQPPLLDPSASPTNFREATLSGSAEPLATVRVFTQPPGSAAPALLGVTVADAAGRFVLGDMILREGSTVFTATATDAATNESASSATVAVTLDTAPPVVTVDTPAEGLFTNALAVSVVGSVDEPVAQLTVGGVTVTLSSQSFSRAGVPLAEGDNTLVVVAFDPAGNKGSAAVTVNRDTLPPTVTIAAPADGLLTNVAQVDISGSVDEPVTAVIVGSAAGLLSGQGYTLAAVALVEGENTLTVSAVDRAGSVGTASVTVRLDSTPPPAPLLDAPVSPTNVATLTLTGAVEAGATVTLFATPPGGGLAELLGTVTADVQGGFSLEGIALAEGETFFTATARDAAGNESAVSTVVAVLLDTVPPVITVTSPADHAVSDALEIHVVGSLSEAATLTLDDGAVVLNGSSFDHPVTLLPGVNTLILQATDLAGNSSVASLTLHADSTPPTVTLTSPPDGLLTRTAAVTVAGSLSESATLTLNGAPLTANGLNFNTLHSLTEGENALTVTATDAAGNVGSASVRVVLDTTAPTLSLSAPTEGNAGQNLPLTVAATDGSGLALVEVRAGGVPVWSASPGGAASLSDAVTYTLSPTLTSGATVDLEARAVDAVGNATTAGARIVVAQGASGPGYLVGEAYDDRRGLRLAGAAWRVSADGAAVASGATSDDGDYFLELPAGEYLVRLEKEGYTAVERQVTVRAEQTTTALDARLTPVSAATHRIGVLGGEVSLSLGSEAAAPALALSLPADALAGEFDLSLTPVSNQGLAGLLPAGWSPLAAFELRALDAVSSEAVADPPVFSEVATFQVPLPQGVALEEGSAPTLARYDETEHAWVAAASAALDTAGTRAETALLRPGHYALLLPDPAPAGPPAAIPGEALPGAAVAVPDYASVTAAGRVVPVASPAAAGITAVGEVVLTPKADPDQPLVSGLTVTGRVTERFNLASGETVQPADYVQDLLLYRAPCVTNPGRGAAGEAAAEGSLRTTFPVSPSRDYTLVELLLGKVGIEIFPAEQGESGGVMVGEAGARLVDAEGVVLEIPAGALTRSVPVSTRAAAGAAALVGSDFRLLRAVAVDLAGETLAASAVLSIPAPEGFDAALPVVVAAVVEAGGVQKLRLVGIGRPAGTMLVSSASITQVLTGDGIVRSGTYCFLQAKAPLGFVRGTVSGQGGANFVGALVTASTISLADVTGSDGRYLLAAPVASFEATALDLAKRDRGTAAGALATASQVLTLDLVIRATPPQVVSVTPADGATGVEPSAALQVVFSEPLDRASVSEQSIQLRDAAETIVPGVFSFSPDGATVTLYPGATLKSETAYSLSISASIRDQQGYTLTQAVTSSFTTRDTAPPPMPPAGSISATFPDAEGMITVTATQGSAETGATVLVINDTTGEIVAVVPQTNGSFTARIAAQLGDEIQVVLMDDAGNQTLVSYLTFKTPDGRYLVTAKGGKVEGEGGLLLEIPEGALVGPAIVKITPVLESELPHPVPAEGVFLKGVSIDTVGVRFQKEVELSVPVPANYPATGTPFVARPITHMNPDGSEEQVYEIVDTAKVVNGRLTTASPPFAGIMDFGLFAFLLNPVLSVGIVDGTTYRDMDGNSTYTPGVDQPVQGAVIRSPQAWNYVAFSRTNGAYAVLAEVFDYVGVSGQVEVTAIHPLTMYRETKTVPTQGSLVVHNLNFKLAEKGTEVPDKTPPVVELALRVAPGQPPESRLVAGTVPVGTELELTVGAIDREIASATLSVEYKTPDMTAPQTLWPGPVLNAAGSELHTPMQGETPALYRYSFSPQFSSTLAGADSTHFRPAAIGTYTLVVEAKDGDDNTSTRRIQVRTVNTGDQPASIDGAPQVDEILPGDGAKEIMVTTPVIVTFSEPVENVTTATLKLIDLQNGAAVPAYVYTGVEGGQMRATLQPARNLQFAHNYRVLVTTAITDAAANPGHGNIKMALEKESAADFITKVPRAFDLAEAERFSGGFDIARYDDLTSSRSYAYVTARENGWRTVDVTDPAAPTVAYARPPLSNVSFRGVGVDVQNGVLGITEDIRFASGGQYGYVRFYDLVANPVNPPKFGQEKLAEAYSGIPGRLDLAGGYAYVATVGAGVQAVDTEAARNDSGASDGSSIAGVFDSLGQGYGHPNDVQFYASAKALITTNSGYLLLLDSSFPALPRLLSAFRPEGYQALRAAGVDAYAYSDAAGNSAVIDFAVTAGLGKLQTVDLSDPYAPKLLGTAVDAAGNPVTVFANDIAVSKSAGLAFVSSFASVQIFDIKDPAHPLLLQTITQLPDENGNLVPIGATGALVEKDGWVYMANQGSGMKTISLGSVPLSLYCESKYKTSIPCTDYYPALGNTTNGGKRTLIFSANDQTKDKTGKVKLKTTILPSSGITIKAEDNTYCPNTQTPCAAIKNGFARFYMQTDATFDPAANQTIPLEFELELNSDPVWQNAEPYNAKVVLKVKNNGNVTMGEVLNGKAVFAYDDGDCTDEDDDTACRSKGAYNAAVTDDNQKHFYYAQELLNQVTPRKRSVTTYTLIEEDGMYGDEAASALSTFKTSFKMGGIKPNGGRIGNTVVNLTNTNGNITYGATDDTTDTFRKLMYDYNLADTTAISQAWVNKIIDKETLIGTERKNEDNIINGSTAGDTGLYELYKNVIEPFNNKMIEEGDLYRNYQGKTWYGRLGEQQGPGVENGNGESYCFGCKNTYSDFGASVTGCETPKEGKVSSAYAANVNDSDCNLTGRQKYPGLKQSEMNRSSQYYVFENWTGIDCAGFVQRMVTAAKGLSIPGVNCSIRDLTDTDTNGNHLDDGGLYSQDFFTGTSRTASFDIPQGNRPSIISEKNKLVSKLKKGDLIRYERHISTVYSARATCSTSAETCNYEIVHAYGSNNYQPLDENGKKDGERIFSRKVIRTRQNIDSVPTGLGRLKLWD